MAERRPLEERVGALERRLDAEIPTEPTDEQAAAFETTDCSPTDLATRLEALEETVAELEAAVEALRGYVGNVEHVNESVERRANAALAAVERLDSGPETPPPIATATREVPESSAEVEGGTDARDHSADGENSSNGDDGLIDRLSALG
jgi:hypothetical protein